MGKNNSAKDAQQTALNNQQNVSNQIQQYAGNQASLNNQFYQPLTSALSQGYQGSISPAAHGLNQGLSTLAGNQGDMSQQTGVNQNQLGQQLTGYDSNPSATNLSQASPGLMNFYQGEMQNGLNPLIAQNAQSQLAQQSAQGMSDAMSHAAPGQNMNALAQENQNSLLANSTNLAGNLAGQGQLAMQQGAQGLGQTAQGLDTQKQNMLLQALTSGMGLNSQALQSLISAMGAGQSALGGSQGFTQQGVTNAQSGMGDLTGVGQQYGNLANQFGQQAASQPGIGSLLGGLLGTAGSMMTGGAAGVGGLGSILGKL